MYCTHRALGMPRPFGHVHLDANACLGGAFRIGVACSISVNAGNRTQNDAMMTSSGLATWCVRLPLAVCRAACPLAAQAARPAVCALLWPLLLRLPALPPLVAFACALGLSRRVVGQFSPLYSSHPGRPSRERKAWASRPCSCTRVRALSSPLVRIACCAVYAALTGCAASRCGCHCAALR